MHSRIQSHCEGALSWVMAFCFQQSTFLSQAGGFYKCVSTGSIDEGREVCVYIVKDVWERSIRSLSSLMMIKFSVNIVQPLRLKQLGEITRLGNGTQIVKVLARQARNSNLMHRRYFVLNMAASLGALRTFPKRLILAFALELPIRTLELQRKPQRQNRCCEQKQSILLLGRPGCHNRISKSTPCLLTFILLS